MRTLIRVWLILLLPALPAPAQQELSLDEARRLARDESFRVKAASQAVSAAAAGVRSARAELLPSLAAVATHFDYTGDVFYARFINPLQPGEPNPAARPTDVGDFSSTSAAVLKLSQPLYAGGALRSGVRASEVEQKIAQEELRQQQLDLDYEVTKAYYDALLAEQAVGVARESEDRSKETLETVRRRRAEEEALEMEELAAKSRLAADSHRLLAAAGDLRFSRLALARLTVGQPEDATRLTDPLAVPRREVDEESAARRALARHPAVAQAAQRVALADELAGVARAHFRPKLELEGYHAWIDSETFFEGTQFGVDLKVSIPFFRQVAAGRGGVARAAASRELEENQQREVSSQVALLARQAARRVQDAYSAVEVARTLLEYQRERHRVTASAFREQLATADGLMDAHAALAEAELGVYGAMHQARLAEAELDRLAPP